MPASRGKLAVPFVGKDMPSQSSEYAHPDITIGLTVLAYRYEGMRLRDFTELINEMRTSLTQEIGPYAQRPSAVLYDDWVKRSGGKIKGAHNNQQPDAAVAAAANDGDLLDCLPASPTLLKQQSSQQSHAERKRRDPEPVVSLRLLRMTSEDQLDNIFALFNKLPQAIHYFLTHFTFPKFMQHQVMKVSANGQDLGGDMLFQQRFGFSGTPSSLLPRELGQCGYEKGADGLMIRTLTDPAVVSTLFLADNWTVKSLLTSIATSTAPRFHSLIDTGALITGMSNLEVAK